MQEKMLRSVALQALVEQLPDVNFALGSSGNSVHQAELSNSTFLATLNLAEEGAQEEHRKTCQGDP